MERSGIKPIKKKENILNFLANLVESCCVSVNALEDIETSDKDEKVDETVSTTKLKVYIDLGIFNREGLIK